MSVTPENAVTTVLVEQEWSRETRRRLEEHKIDPDGLDAKGAENRFHALQYSTYVRYSTVHYST